MPHEVVYQRGSVAIVHGNCLEVLRALDDSGVDSIVTDPPYGLGFMGKEWDYLPPGEDWARECLRVLKPGGYLLAFGGSRTWHRLAVAIEDAGFEIRDSIAWLYGSGFPKSLDVSKAIDKLDAAAERLARAREFQAWLRQHVTPQQVNDATGSLMGHLLTTHPNQPAIATPEMLDQLRPLLPEIPDRIEELVRDRRVESVNFMQRPPAEHASRPGMAESWTDGTGWNGSAARGGSGVTEEARAWQGWGTSLKPAFEPIVVGRKPFPSTVAANVLEHGTGALNIDGCRIPTSAEDARAMERANTPGSGRMKAGGSPIGTFERSSATGAMDTTAGRWPTNVVLDESQAAELDKQSGFSQSPSGPVKGQRRKAGVMGAPDGNHTSNSGHGDSGGASRFFPVFKYQAKAPAKERPKDADGKGHPTVKPLELMRWLVRLVTPPGGTVLEPFAGSGTTVEACLLEGFKCFAIEREPDYLPLIMQRIERSGSESEDVA